MKLGTENKTKTIIALVLVGLALIFVVRWLFFTDTGTASADIPKPVVASVAQQTAPAAQEPTSPAKRTRQRTENSDQKILTAPFKPSLDPTLNLAMLARSESIKYEGSGRNIFASSSEPEIPKQVAPGLIKQQPQATAAPVVNTPPPPPPINLKFYGFASKTGAQKSIFLSQDGNVIVAKEGDIVARRYKIVRINATSIEVLDMLSNNKQTIMLTSG